MEKSVEKVDFESEKRTVNLEASWLKVLAPEFEKESMITLRSFLKDELRSGKKIYPKAQNIFNAFTQTPFEKVKIVIIGQDPYHGPGQAHGLSFSVQEGVRHPPSLQNIFKELNADLGVPIPKSGDLTPWAQQGVLLLNAVLTVEDGKAASHQKRGWEQFTDAVVSVINEKLEGVIFLLWGAFAIKKAQHVDRKKHFVIESVHPSPLSAHRGFLGSRPFSKINGVLETTGREPINWRL